MFFSAYYTVYQGFYAHSHKHSSWVRHYIQRAIAVTLVFFFFFFLNSDRVKELTSSCFSKAADLQGTSDANFFFFFFLSTHFSKSLAPNSEDITYFKPYLSRVCPLVLIVALGNGLCGFLLLTLIHQDLPTVKKQQFVTFTGGFPSIFLSLYWSLALIYFWPLTHLFSCLKLIDFVTNFYI